MSQKNKNSKKPNGSDNINFGPRESFVLWYKLQCAIAIPLLIIGALLAITKGWYYILPFVSLIGSGVRVIKPFDSGAGVFLGRPLVVFDSGPVLALPLLSQVLTFPRTIIRMEIGQTLNKEGEPIHESEKDIELKTQEGGTLFVTDTSPFRITFKNGTKENQEKDDLHRRLTGDPKVLVGFRIQYPLNLLRSVGTRDALESLSRDLSSQVRSALQEYCGRVTLSELIEKIKRANEKIKESLELLVGEKSGQSGVDPEFTFGVNILFAQITYVGIPYDTNKAMAQAAASPFQEEVAMREARGPIKGFREGFQEMEPKAQQAYTAIKFGENGNTTTIATSLGEAITALLERNIHGGTDTTTPERGGEE